MSLRSATIIAVRKVPPESTAKPTVTFHCIGCGQWLPRVHEDAMWMNGVTWVNCVVCDKPNPVERWGLVRVKSE